MSSFVQNPSSIRRSDLIREGNSFSVYQHKIVPCPNKNTKTVKQLLKRKINGFEPGSEEYVNFSDNYFVRISDMDDLNYTFSVKPGTQKIRPVQGNNSEKIIQNGDICYQTASNVGNVCIYTGSCDAFFNSHIINLEFNQDKYYIFGFLKSNFGKNQVEVAGSIKGVDNFRETLLLNTIIPFPTKKIHKNPSEVIKYFSLIVQNIIDKELVIKEKISQIYELIEDELNNNQKNNTFTYKYPKKSEIVRKKRLDSLRYKCESKEFNFKITNYEFGYSNLSSLEFEVKRGQNLQISNIGKSIYSDHEENNFYRLILSSHISEDSTLKKWTYLGNKKKLKKINKEDIIFCSRGAQFGRVMIFPEEINAITNIDNMHIYNENASLNQKIFLTLFLSYLRNTRQIYQFGMVGNGSISLTKYQLDTINFPNFPEEKQKEIAYIYYNPLKHVKTNFTNYLNKERLRNKEIGIYQLNMEIIKLRQILDNLIWNIVNELEIIINLNY